MPTDSKTIKKSFINYFKENSHTIVPSSKVFPLDDPTILFTNAGMNQFKDVFLGKDKRSYKTAASCQKCIRAGGKHNDLENVGFTSRHLTFFEMLGNFSFGDYFKEKAIAYAFDVTLNVFGLDKDKIWATIYKDDDESYELWKKFLPENKIVRFGEKDNFWTMGDVGPCGPCSELLFDRGEKFSDAPSPLFDPHGERYIEFWNLVFMEFDSQTNGSKIPLIQKSIDTGCGLERVIVLKNNFKSVFETDIFRGLIDKIENISKVKYDPKNEKIRSAFHVISDHIRCLCFAIADGAVPSNIERGYVLRKILRRAFRFGKVLNLTKPFLKDLVPALSSLMGEDYPELIVKQNFIEEVLTLEEQSFIKTLKTASSLMSDIIEIAKKEKRDISGEEAFKLKDTFGFPIEEIELIAKDENLKIDLKKYEILEQRAKELSKKSKEKVSQEFNKNFFSDFSSSHKCEFIGYKTYIAESKIISLVQDEKYVDELQENSFGIIILDKTCFYPEKGGQIADTGQIIFDNNIFQVEDTLSPFKDVIIHIGKVKKGTFKIDQKVKCEIDKNKREKIEKNHTSTHLLHLALMEVLKETSLQKGSLVDQDKLRFDFSSINPLTENQIRQVERFVNEKIRENIEVKDYSIPFEEAQKDPTIVQIFGEKYSDQVRVIDVFKSSKELCSGCHVSRTGSIGYFRILKESSISKGIRRIEAVTGQIAEDFVYETEDEVKKIASNLKIPPNKLEEKILSLLDENKTYLSEVKSFKDKFLSDLADSLIQKKELFNSYTIIFEKVSLDAKDLKILNEKLLSKLKSCIIVLASTINERLQILISVSKDNIEKNIFANDLIKKISPIINGKGGGKKDTAQAGGSNISGIEKAFEEIKNSIKNT